MKKNIFTICMLVLLSTFTGSYASKGNKGLGPLDNDKGIIKRRQNYDLVQGNKRYPYYGMRRGFSRRYYEIRAWMRCRELREFHTKIRFPGGTVIYQYNDGRKDKVRFSEPAGPRNVPNAPIKAQNYNNNVNNIQGINLFETF